MFAPTAYTGLFAVHENGGTPQPLTALNQKNAELSHRYPQVLTDGRIVFGILTDRPDSPAIGIVEPGGRCAPDPAAARDAAAVCAGQRSPALRRPASGRRPPADGRAGAASVMAVRLRHGEIEGAPVPVAGGLAALTVWGLAVFTTGPHGALLSMAAPEAPLSRLVWVGREQESTPLPLPARRYVGARLSPEGRSSATTIVDDDVGVWLAVKVLAPEVATTLGPERFLREIEIAARLTHPHILPLHDSGELAGFLFFVMPHVDGGSLRARLARHVRLPLTEVLRIAEQIAAALDYAHRQGVVHRDVKPDNVLLHEGAALLADFGVALALGPAASEQLTRTGFALGTPAYMSPEQLTGDRPVDVRVDVYALGCLLYKMLSGEPRVAGSTAGALLARKLTETPPLLHVVRSDVPEGVSHVVAKALARVPADRFATVAEFAAALRDPTPVTIGATKSVVVLPFVNLSPDRGTEYFAETIARKDERGFAAASRFPPSLRNPPYRTLSTRTGKGCESIGCDCRQVHMIERVAIACAAAMVALRSAVPVFFEQAHFDSTRLS